VRDVSADGRQFFYFPRQNTPRYQSACILDALITQRVDQMTLIKLDGNPRKSPARTSADEDRLDTPT